MSIDKFLVTIIILLIPFGSWYWYTETHDVAGDNMFISDVSFLHVGDNRIAIEIADTDAARTLGLSGRSAIDKQKGLLFMFPETDYHGMWMKDMRFSIDIVWIGEDLKVVDIAKGVSPETYPRVFRPKVPALYVLEVNSGYVDLIGINVGQTVRLPLE